jgi:hypothetical protein
LNRDGGKPGNCCRSSFIEWTIAGIDPALQAVFAERIDNYREHCTVLQKIRGRSAMKTLFAELENYAGSEFQADYD